MGLSASKYIRTVLGQCASGQVEDTNFRRQCPARDDPAGLARRRSLGWRGSSSSSQAGWMLWSGEDGARAAAAAARGAFGPLGVSTGQLDMMTDLVGQDGQSRTLGERYPDPRRDRTWPGLAC